MEIDPSELSQVVERLTGRATTTEWRLEELHQPVPSASLGIWRVAGDGWSSVLKLIGLGETRHPNWEAGSRPDHWYYWRREVHAYESGLLDALTGGLRAPRCHLVSERGPATIALWLEDVQMPAGTQWPLERYELAACHLGRAQGRFLTADTLPTFPWLSRDWLRAYLTMRDRDMALLTDESAWTLPIVRRWLPNELAQPLVSMRRHQRRFLSALASVPQTLCHFDLHPANLFGNDGETVLIDWSFVGVGAIGEDAGNLVVDAVLDFHVDPSGLDQLYAYVQGGYLRGLRDSGWRGPAVAVELGMRAGIAAKFAWIAPAMLRAAVDGRQTLNGRAVPEAFALWAGALPFLVLCATEASRLVELGPDPGDVSEPPQ
jgi:hypothetical protein